MVMSNFDHNWYTFIEGEMYAIIIFYVEDLVLIGDNLVKLAHIEKQLERRFEMSKLGLMKLCLGVQFVYLLIVSTKVIMHRSSWRGLGWKFLNWLQCAWKNEYICVLTWG